MIADIDSLVREYISRGKTKKLIKILKNHLKARPRDVDVLRNLFSLYMLIGEVSKALEVVEENSFLLELEDIFKDYFRTLLIVGELERASEVINKKLSSVKNKEEEIVFLPEYVSLLMLESNFEEAQRVVKELEGMFPNSSYLLEAKANILLSEDPKKAAEFYERALQIKNDLVLRRSFADILKALGRYEEAKRLLLRNISENPLDVASYALLVEIFLSEGDLKNAEMMLNKVPRGLRISPTIMLAEARILVRKNPKKAEKVLDKVFKKSDNVTTLLYEIGLLYISLLKLQKAEKVFRKIIRIAPKSPSAHLMLALIYLLNHDIEKAKQYINLIEEEYPKLFINNPLYWSIKGDIELFSKRYNNAISCYERALKLEKNSERKRKILEKINFAKKRVAAVESSNIEA